MKYVLLLGAVVIVGLLSLYAFGIFNGDQMQADGMLEENSEMELNSFEDVMQEDITLGDTSDSKMQEKENTDTIEETQDNPQTEKEGENIEDNQDDDMKASTDTIAVADVQTTTMLVAGGCFWCVESDLEKLSGVVEVVSGYADGDTQNPTYKNYIQGGHREVVEVTYNPSVVSFEEVLITTLKHTDPTDDDGSFGDRGDYYSTAFYYETESEKQIIDNLIKEVDEFGPYDKPLAIDVLKRPEFWTAEDYHQDYYKGTLSKLKYKYYRNASGRDAFIEKYWGDETSASFSWRDTNVGAAGAAWNVFVKPEDTELMSLLTDIQYKVTQKNGTERSFNNPYWDNHEEGIYVDIVSSEPLFSSTHKFDSGTGWPSFTRPIEYNMVTEHDDYVLLRKRTEVRSKIADSHLGHIFNDAPKELGGIRYCMNSASLRFVPKEKMEEEGYGEYLALFE